MWPFGKKDKDKNKKAKNADSAPQSEKDAKIEQAMANFRTAQQELGPETIEAMQRAARIEKLKDGVKNAIDDKEGHNREAVVETLRDIRGKDD